MGQDQVIRYETADGRRIYRIRVEVFRGLPGNVYLVSDGEGPVLVDCGSGFATSVRDLEAGLESIGPRFGETARPEDLSAILITHGHIDHFGGLGFLRRRTSAPILVHMLDRRVLSHYEERVVVASRHVRRFLKGAGVGEERCQRYMEMYLGTKSLFRSVRVESPFEEEVLLGGRFRAHHVPGHCPGQVCVGVDDVLLTADHLLPRISPHVSPESITQNTGLRHYLNSLRTIERLEGYRLGLGGHEGPIVDLPGRAARIRRLHEERLDRVLDLCERPRSIAEVSLEIFGRTTSYHVLLALLEAGALVEYLYQRGALVAANVEQIESESDPVILYRRE